MAVGVIALLNACVLYPAVLRDVLLTLAEAEIYQIRWTKWRETSSKVVERTAECEG